MVLRGVSSLNYPKFSTICFSLFIPHACPAKETFICMPFTSQQHFDVHDFSQKKEKEKNRTKKIFISQLFRTHAIL